MTTVPVMAQSAQSSDRSDPAVRAAVRLERLEARDQTARVTKALMLGVVAIVAPLTAAPITGDPGATVGAIVGGLLALALAVAVWPYEWSVEERRHRELEAIWRELRSDADAGVPWERYGAWAEPVEDAVQLVLVTCAPAAPRVGGAPSPYSRRVVRRLDPDDVAAAAQAMEELRADAAQRELRAQQRYEQANLEAQRQTDDRTLREIDETAAADLRAREQQLEREFAEQQAAERRAQAEAVARALRRP